MVAASTSSNVIALAPYRAARMAQRPARQYLLWYPGIGFLKSGASVASGAAAGARTIGAHRPERA